MAKTTALAPNRNAMELVLKLEDAGALTPTSLTITDPDMAYETWESLGVMFGKIDRACRWWVGDWINHGEALYGDDASQAVEATLSERYDLAHRVTGLDQGTLMNLASVCRKVAKSRRREELPISIHVEVAKLGPREQKKWLSACIKHGWSRSELREQIKLAEEGLEPEDEGAGNGGGHIDELSHAEQLELAARLVWQQGQATEEGAVLVPSEAWVQLGAALGEVD